MKKGQDSTELASSLATRLTAEQVERWARELDAARLESRERDRISTEHPDFTLEDAYRIHDAGIALRSARGERLAGYKMGLTSEAKRKQMGLDTPIYGTLTDRMIVKTGKFPLQGSIHPKAEPEIAFLTRAPLSGEISVAQAMDACEGVGAAIEILDSRFVGFKYFSLNDVVADNASSSHLVLGPWLREFRDLTLAEVEMKFFIGDRLAETARGAAISGDPWISLCQLSALLGSRGKSLPAGSVVLAGAATAAVALEPGMTVALEVTGLERASFIVV